jgi:hypothetical protein
MLYQNQTPTHEVEKLLDEAWSFCGKSRLNKGELLP